MSNNFGCLLSALVLSAAGCSAQSLQRSSYETLQNIEQQRCEEDLSSECPRRESFDVYQRERRELQQGD
jgi:hypothetical protein